MKALVVEDDLTSRIFLKEMLEVYGTVDVAVDGQEALNAFSAALAAGHPYHLICLDINMPKRNGQDVLKIIRHTEKTRGVRSAIVFMTTGDRKRESVIHSAKNKCNGYLVKPIEGAAIEAALRKCKLII